MKTISKAKMLVVGVALLLGMSAGADETKPEAAVKEEAEAARKAKAEKKEINRGMIAESSRREARSSAKELFESSFKGYQEGILSLDRVITVHRMMIELDTEGRKIALESLPGMFSKFHGEAQKISALVRARVDAGATGRQDFQFAETHRLMLAFRQKKAEANLDRLKRGGR